MTKKQILIIDDDEELGEEMAEILESEGYSASVVSDGPRGIELIRSRHYDVFLLDFKMQGISGTDLVREIRKTGSKAAVFLVSGRPGLEAMLKEENLAGSIDGIIEKPFNVQFLLDSIKASSQTSVK